MCLVKMTVSNDSEEFVILVDEADRFTGTGPKLETHLEGLLHRAFSIFIFDDTGRTLIQRRAMTKYHSGGLWANTCCGHPRPGESIAAAASRRLMEELGFKADLSFGFHSRYRADLDHDMVENEFVHVLFGVSDAACYPEPTEVSEVDYWHLEDLRDAALCNGSAQTVWLRHYLDTHFDELLGLRQKSSLATISNLSTSTYV